MKTRRPSADEKCPRRAPRETGDVRVNPHQFFFPRWKETRPKQLPIKTGESFWKAKWNLQSKKNVKINTKASAKSVRLIKHSEESIFINFTIMNLSSEKKMNHFMHSTLELSHMHASVTPQSSDPFLIVLLATLANRNFLKPAMLKFIASQYKVACFYHYRIGQVPSRPLSMTTQCILFLAHFLSHPSVFSQQPHCNRYCKSLIH